MTTAIGTPVFPSSRPTATSFADRILPAPLHGGFAMDDYWVWCGSVVAGDDGRFHMFASRVSRSLGFAGNWLFNSEIVRAASLTPEGPYQFEEVVFARRDRHFFDAMNTHNPSVKRAPDGTFLLYYFGATYDGTPPGPGEAIPHARYVAAWNNKRIGLATSASVLGPWQRPDRPLLEPRPGHWDCTATTNPSAVILPDSSAYMIYKSRAGDGRPLQLGITRARHWAGPYVRMSDAPILSFDDPNLHVEDPFLWMENGRFHVLMKDDSKNGSPGLTGECGAGASATSDDCLHWTLAEDPKAYSRVVRWDDGTVTTQANLERPNLLIQNGRPTHLFCATGDGDRPWHFSRTRNICLPLSQ